MHQIIVAYDGFLEYTLHQQPFIYVIRLRRGGEERECRRADALLHLPCMATFTRPWENREVMQQKKILIVDDDKKTIDLIRLYLEKEHYEVLAAYDGQEALAIARQEKPSLV